MGYDFTFVRLAPRPERFPFEPPGAIDDRIQALRSAQNLDAHLLPRADFRCNGPGYLWNAPDGGRLYVSVHETAVYVDTHAHWKHVLELYEFCCQVEPELLILDNTKAVIHNAESYQQYIADSYSGKTQRAPTYRGRAD